MVLFSCFARAIVDIHAFTTSLVGMLRASVGTAAAMNLKPSGKCDSCKNWADRLSTRSSSRNEAGYLGTYELLAAGVRDWY